MRYSVVGVVHFLIDVFLQDTRVRLNPNNNLTGNDYINANHVNVSTYCVVNPYKLT